MGEPLPTLPSIIKPDEWRKTMDELHHKLLTEDVKDGNEAILHAMDDQAFETLWVNCDPRCVDDIRKIFTQAGYYVSTNDQDQVKIGLVHHE